MFWRKTVFGISSSLVRLLRTRLEIFALELGQEKLRFIKLFGLALVALQLLMLALLIATMLVVMFFWSDENRYVLLALLAAGYGMAGIILLAVVRHGVSVATPFAVTLEELGRDAQLLAQIRHREADDKLKNHRATGDEHG